MATPPGPGSFTKNFAWHGQGMRLLHDGIKIGFNGKISDVERDNFRATVSAFIPPATPAFDDAQFLLAANFFLHNVIRNNKNVIPVDELVRLSVAEPYTPLFDRVALFGFNLSLGGQRRGVNGVADPAPWAREFVKQAMWQNGRWQRAALDEAAMDAFLATRISGVAAAKTKVRTNYRHLYVLAKYLPAPHVTINSGANAWMVSAMFLAWDRRALAAGGHTGPVNASALVAGSDTEEDWKLLGITREEFMEVAPGVASQYATAGGVTRFQGVLPTPVVPTINLTLSTPTSLALAAPRQTSADLKWLTASGDDVAVDRRLSHRFAQKRDVVLATKLKALYNHKCMACGLTVVIGVDPNRCYAEAAHIRPLGNPHNGPDKPGNMIVLCPSHHIQLDVGVLGIRSGSSGGFKFISKVSGDPAHNKMIQFEVGHTLDPACVQWHADKFA